MYPAVASEEVAFAMTLFVSAANGHSQAANSFTNPVDSRGCEEIFFDLCFGSMAHPESFERAALLESSIFRAFCTVWHSYLGDPMQDALCARVLGFCFLMERSRGKILQYFETAKHDGDLVALHPAVVETVARVELGKNGMLSEATFLDRLMEVAELYPDLARLHSRRSLRREPETDGVLWPAGEGEAAELMRRKEWSQSPLGAVASWPQSLRSAVELALACGFPMIVLWSPDLIQLYNDAYRDLMGSKHPAGLGQPTRVCWPEVWSINEPLYAKVFAGESITLEDQLFPIVRYGYLENAYFTLCYSPLRDEVGKISGVLVTVFETTLRARARLHRGREADTKDTDGGFQMEKEATL